MYAAAHPQTDLKTALEEWRASVAGDRARKGLAGKIQTAILSFLETLLAILLDFRAGRLAAVDPATEASPGREEAACASDGATARPSRLHRARGDARGRGDELRASLHLVGAETRGDGCRVAPPREDGGMRPARVVL